MERESLINEFLERLESAVDAEVEPCDCEGVPDSILANVKVSATARREIYEHKKECDATATGTLDKTAARAALDRLFKDLNDFVKEPKKPAKRKIK